jgi:hypothetical protein
METKNLTIGVAVAGIILIIIASGVLGQPSVYDVAGMAKLNGNLVTPGTLIVAKDANGTEMGSFIVNTTGSYGYLHVNGDVMDSIGDVISFFINGVQADQTLVWQSQGKDPNFNLTACDLSTYAVTVQTDSGVYYPGQDMTITGYLVNSQCSLEPGKTVAYSVPSTAIMGQIATNGTGYFSLVVTIPSDMVLGNYTLWASYPPGANETVYDTANFTVSEQPSQTQVVTTTGGGGGGGGGACLQSWNCSDFSECQPDGTQTRTCVLEQNKCGTSLSKPNETQTCTYVPPAAGACTPGSRMCLDKDLMECNSTGQWVNIQTCDYLCSGNACVEKPAEAGPGNETVPGAVPVTGSFLLEPSSWPYWILIAFVVILIAWYLLRRRRKKKPQQKK